MPDTLRNRTMVSFGIMKASYRIETNLRNAIVDGDKASMKRWAAASNRLWSYLQDHLSVTRVDWSD